MGTELSWYDEDIHVAYSEVLRTAEAYERVRARYTGKGYSVLGNGNPETHRNWPHFVKATKAIKSMGAHPVDWMNAQFSQTTSSTHPYPNQLATKAAKERYEESRTAADLPALYDTMVRTLVMHMHNLDATAEEILSQPNFSSFYPWFRALHLSEVPEPWRTQTKRVLRRSKAVRELIMEKYDYDELLRKIGGL